MQRLTIGQLAARCGLSRSALRFYDECGLLRPVAVDEATGYRYYDEAQVAIAETIRRLRSAEVDIDGVRRFLGADEMTRQRLLDEHLASLERRFGAIRAEVSRLRSDQQVPGCMVSAPLLATAVDQVLVAASNDSTRPELAAVLVEIKDDSLRLVATDTHRMAVRDLVPNEAPMGPVRRGLVAACALAAVREPLATGAICRLAVRESLEMQIDGEQHELVTLDDHFPDYEAVLLDLPPGARTIVGRAELASNLEALDSTAVTFVFRAGCLALDDGVSRRELSAEWSAPAVYVVLNRSYALEAVGAQLGPDVAIEVVGALRPVTFRSADTGTYCMLVMPIRA